eukprot:TRINITY_DN544_c0_g1_i3.p1 TRINITY_DN544_c0_g1~~TRINITY_DN544_c0_g1_i3.p1  ORF type:complete len:311 (-),score=57.16 TRINITY_DN544_c0_g1_i3:785-1717(-)
MPTTLFDSLFKQLKENIVKTQEWKLSSMAEREEMRKTVGLDLVVEAVSLCRSEPLTDKLWKIMRNLPKVRALSVESAARCGNVRLLEYLLNSSGGRQNTERFASMAWVAGMEFHHPAVISLTKSKGAKLDLRTAIRFDNVSALCQILQHQTKPAAVELLFALKLALKKKLTKAVALLVPVGVRWLENTAGNLKGKLKSMPGTISEVAFLLRMNSSLQTLDLAGNDIGNEGADAIAQVLLQNSSLQSCDLSDNGILKEGADSIAQALLKNSTLQSLDLSGNVVGNKGADAIAQVLLQNSSLQSVNLSRGMT